MNGPALNTDPRDPVAEELHLMKTAGIVEVACRNPNVMDAILHWEDRVQKAEAAVAAARAEGMRAGMLKAADQLEQSLFWAPFLSDAETKAWVDGSRVTVTTSAAAIRAAAEASK